ncbi:MAG TPA: DUF6089 family protein [Cyclobacteriaceae bacterium]|nr:hypothetical protein [Cyclobacteriaceae bacterium]HMV07842.1 DUF6089 family protein [Cyclobacteriaceae bacterium]HMV88110.1 DUF6089 family protein [Cyclobacteriaceae bacterium]HMW98976.1 DUF6089 family protein [Cyclobacteriaceae bacterium]HMX48390.1 DUF6089 family protein [Cyclobacteriaceae bacterium]
MKKVGLLLLIMAFFAVSAQEAYSQINRRNIKKSNRNIGNFRGNKSSFKRNIYNAVGISLNAFNYYGDLSPSAKKLSTDLAFTRPAVGGSFVHRFGPRYQLVASFMFGGIKGSDSKSADPNDQDAAFRYVRNLSFRNRIQEISVVGQIDLFENDATYLSRAKWTPYLYAGIAVFHHNPQAKVPDTDLTGAAFPNAGEWVDLQPLKTEGKDYKLVQAAIPFGLGVRFKLTEVIDIAGEFGFRYTFTDYLDDVSGYYVDLRTLDGELARAMSYRSNEVKTGVSNKVDAIIANKYHGYEGDLGYTTVAGFGHVNEDEQKSKNIRGTGDKDLYMVTSVRVTYIINRNYHRAKFR